MGLRQGHMYEGGLHAMFRIKVNGRQVRAYSRGFQSMLISCKVAPAELEAILLESALVADVSTIPVRSTELNREQACVIGRPHEK